MENRPAFFKFFIREISELKLKIPPTFMQRIQTALPQIVVLRDRYGNFWEVKAVEVENNWFFTDGWKIFVEENSIKGGEVIVFNYYSRGFFGFKIYGSSGCETKGVGSLKPKNIENHEKQLNDGGGGTRANPSEKKRKFDWFGAQIFQSGVIPKPGNPYFVTKFSRIRKYELNIPIEVINAYKLQLPEVMTFVDPQGREFYGERKIWKDGRILYAKGWKSLCDKNSVKNEDKCICEFIRRESGELCINVKFVRANR